jgi:hypothetical protein
MNTAEDIVLALCGIHHCHDDLHAAGRREFADVLAWQAQRVKLAQLQQEAAELRKAPTPGDTSLFGAGVDDVRRHGFIGSVMRSSRAKPLAAPKPGVQVKAGGAGVVRMGGRR